MRLKSIAKNQTELTFNMYHGQMTVFFSYETPVAYLFDGNYARKTEKRFSNTTTGHINAFFERYGFNGKKVDTIPQENISELINNHI